MILLKIHPFSRWCIPMLFIRKSSVLSAKVDSHSTSQIKYSNCSKKVCIVIYIILMKASAGMILQHLPELGQGSCVFISLHRSFLDYVRPYKGDIALGEVAFFSWSNHSKQTTDKSFLPAALPTAKESKSFVPKRILSSTIRYPPQSIPCTLWSSRILNALFSWGKLGRGSPLKLVSDCNRYLL